MIDRGSEYTAVCESPGRKKQGRGTSQGPKSKELSEPDRIREERREIFHELSPPENRTGRDMAAEEKRRPPGINEDFK